MKSIRSDSALGLGAVGGGRRHRLARPLVRRLGPTLGLLDEARGLRDRGLVGLGGLMGQPLPLEREVAPGVLQLAVGTGLDLLRLALGLGAQRARLLGRGEPELGGLAVGRLDELVGLGLDPGALALEVGVGGRLGLVELALAGPSGLR